MTFWRNTGRLLELFCAVHSHMHIRVSSSYSWTGICWFSTFHVGFICALLHFSKLGWVYRGVRSFAFLFILVFVSLVISSSAVSWKGSFLKWRITLSGTLTCTYCVIVEWWDWRESVWHAVHSPDSCRLARWQCAEWECRPSVCSMYLLDWYHCQCCKAFMM